MSLYSHCNGINFDKLSKEDLPLLLRLKEESWHSTHRVSFVNIDDQQEWYRSLCSQSVHFPSSLILIASNSEKIGIFKVLNICWQNRKAEVGWDIFLPYRKKGYGCKLVKAGVDFCFKVMNLHRLRADILEINEASKKCAVRAGFEYEGCERKAIWKNDCYIDSHIYGVISG